MPRRRRRERLGLFPFVSPPTLEIGAKCVYFFPPSLNSPPSLQNKAPRAGVIIDEHAEGLSSEEGERFAREAELE